MATFILLGTIAEGGTEQLQQHPEWVDELNHDMENMGVKLLAQYAVLGPYDIVTIIEAPDNRTVIRVSTQLTLRGNVKVTTLPALPISDFLASLK
jgi:uncharacterized protein with GYD domain